MGAIVLLGSEYSTHLNTEISSVHIISQEEVSSVFGIASDFEELHQIEVLPMNITADRDGRIHLQQIRLALEHFCAHLYDPQRLFFGQSTLSIEVLFQELEVGLAAVIWRTELFLCGWTESRRLDVWNMMSVRATGFPM